MDEKRVTAKCTLCGLEVVIILRGGNDETKIDAVQYSNNCKLADEKAGFDCPRLLEAIRKASGP